MTKPREKTREELQAEIEDGKIDILKVKSTMNYPSSSTYSTQTSKDLATATADASLSENAIVFDDVTFAYSKAGAPSLSHISFSVKKGQTVGIIGGTGSGKTTLVNLISRFYDASKGTVLLGSVGRITEYNFNMLSEKYQAEQHELDEKIQELQAVSPEQIYSGCRIIHHPE